MIFYRLWFDEKVFLNNGFKSHLEIIQSSTSFSYSVLFHILQTKVVVVSLFTQPSKLIPSEMEAAPPHNKLLKLSIKVSSFGSNSSVQKITKTDKETVRLQPP